MLLTEVNPCRARECTEHYISVSHPDTNPTGLYLDARRPTCTLSSAFSSPEAAILSVSTSGWFRTRKSANHGLPARLRNLRNLKQLVALNGYRNRPPLESEAIRANLHGNKRILKWRPFWNKVYSCC